MKKILLAKQLKVSRQYIYYLTQNRYPSVEQLMLLIEYFELNPQETTEFKKAYIYSRYPAVKEIIITLIEEGDN